MRMTSTTTPIDTHVADELADQAVQDLVMNPRTPSFRALPRKEMTARIAALYRDLATWIAEHDDDAVRSVHETWGRTRFREAIPISEIAYAVILAKQHLRRYVAERGLTGLQALEPAIGEFFDRALYYLIRGYEMQAATTPRVAQSRPA